MRRIVAGILVTSMVLMAAWAKAGWFKVSNEEKFLVKYSVLATWTVHPALSRAINMFVYGLDPKEIRMDIKTSTRYGVAVLPVYDVMIEMMDEWRSGDLGTSDLSKWERKILEVFHDKTVRRHVEAANEICEVFEKHSVDVVKRKRSLWERVGEASADIGVDFDWPAIYSSFTCNKKVGKIIRKMFEPDRWKVTEDGHPYLIRVKDAWRLVAVKRLDQNSCDYAARQTLQLTPTATVLPAEWEELGEFEVYGYEYKVCFIKALTVFRDEQGTIEPVIRTEPFVAVLQCRNGVCEVGSYPARQAACVLWKLGYGYCPKYYW